MKNLCCFDEDSAQTDSSTYPEFHNSCCAAERLRLVSEKLVRKFTQHEDILTADTDFKSALALFTELRSSSAKNESAVLASLTAFLHACALMEATADLLDDVEQMALEKSLLNKEPKTTSRFYEALVSAYCGLDNGKRAMEIMRQNGLNQCADQVLACLVKSKTLSSADFEFLEAHCTEKELLCEASAKLGRIDDALRFYDQLTRLHRSATLERLVTTLSANNQSSVAYKIITEQGQLQLCKQVESDFYPAS